MGSEAGGTKGRTDAHAAAKKAAFLFIAAGCVASGAALVAASPRALGAGVGFTIGSINFLWLLRIIGKAVALAPEKAGRVVTRGYYVRFAAVALVVAAVAAKGLVRPAPLVAGLIASVFAALIVFYIMAKKES